MARAQVRPVAGRGRTPPAPDSRELLAGLALTLVVAASVALTLDLSPAYVAYAGMTFAAIAALLHRARRGRGLAHRLNPADRVTLARALLVALLAGLAPEAAAMAPGSPWLVGAGVAALALDGLDGLVARRRDTVTALGARFDMELDAFFILVLALLVFQLGKAGPWVLLLGAPRYAFLAAGRMLPALRAELAPSRRRRLVCVLQAATPVACLAPVVGAGAAAAACGAALALACASFAVDIAALLRRPLAAPAAAPSPSRRTPP